jgi:hypothetical protein
MRFIFEVEIVADKLIPPPPAFALGIADRPWSIGDLLDAALAIEAARTDRDGAGSASRGVLAPFGNIVRRYGV